MFKYLLILGLTVSCAYAQAQNKTESGGQSIGSAKPYCRAFFNEMKNQEFSMGIYGMNVEELIKRIDLTDDGKVKVKSLGLKETSGFDYLLEPSEDGKGSVHEFVRPTPRGLIGREEATIKLITDSKGRLTRATMGIDVFDLEYQNGKCLVKKIRDDVDPSLCHDLYTLLKKRSESCGLQSAITKVFVNHGMRMTDSDGEPIPPMNAANRELVRCTNYKAVKAMIADDSLWEGVKNEDGLFQVDALIK